MEMLGEAKEKLAPKNRLPSCPGVGIRPAYRRDPGRRGLGERTFRDGFQDLAAAVQHRDARKNRCLWHLRQGELEWRDEDYGPSDRFLEMQRLILLGETQR
jgi:hypothetical protein